MEEIKNEAVETAEEVVEQASEEVKEAEVKAEEVKGETKEFKPRYNKSNNRNGRNFKRNNNRAEKEFEERVVKINRITKVVKGGRKMRFSALVVIGNGKGKVGFGTGKANEVPDAIKKATQAAHNNIVTIPMVGDTIPHEITGHYGAGRVFLRPASEGTGVIAGGPVRAVMELAGVKNVLTKCLGSRTPINMVRATFDGISNMKTWEQVKELRGLDNKEEK